MAGAVTGRHGQTLVNAALGLPYDANAMNDVKGRVPRVDPVNPGGTNLPFAAAWVDYASAEEGSEKDKCRALLLEGLNNDRQTVKFQEGGYDPMWKLIVAASLYLGYDDDQLRDEVLAFARRQVLLGALFCVGGVSVPLGGRYDHAPEPVQNVFTSMMIGLPVDRSRQWWLNKGNIGALMLAVWINEHGLNEIVPKELREVLRSWVNNGRAPIETWAEVKLYDGVEIRRYEDRLIAWCQNGVRSFVRQKPKSLPLVAVKIDNTGMVYPFIMDTGAPVTSDGVFLKQDSEVLMMLPEEQPLSSLTWDSSVWTGKVKWLAASSIDSPLPKVDRSWLPRGDVNVPNPTPVNSQYDEAIKNLVSGIDLAQRSKGNLDRQVPRPRQARSLGQQAVEAINKAVELLKE